MLKNIKIARETTKISKDSYYIIDDEKVYLDNPDDSIVYNKNNPLKNNDLNKKGEIVVKNIKTLDAVYNEFNNNNLKIGALNFANGLIPGGGYRWGAKAQEEDFFRRTNIRSTLNIRNKFYFDNWFKFNRFLYHNNIIVSENISLFRDHNYELIDIPQTFTVLSSSAVVYTLAKFLFVSRSQVKKVMKARIINIFEAAKSNDIDILVLGAFGCGAYGNKKEDIAPIFKELLEGEYKYSFEKVIFAISTRDIDSFNYWKNTIEPF